jgi:uncharacterized protein RhaS with RHS repeats
VSGGHYKLGARYYDPATGRFTQYDPSWQEANPYGYGAGEPVNMSDPTGLEAIMSAVKALPLVVDFIVLGIAISSGDQAEIAEALVGWAVGGITTAICGGLTVGLPAGQESWLGADATFSG